MTATKNDREIHSFLLVVKGKGDSLSTCVQLTCGIDSRSLPIWPFARL